MLTEHFIASIGAPDKASKTPVLKDASIYIHEHQPLLAQRLVFKKSATAPNCLAVSGSHIFAAQLEKAVVHIYSRQHGNQEATVPFTERITCLALACRDTVLVLGTAEGRLILWEIASGRQVSTAQSHLQAITTIAIDPTGNLILSGSEDSTVQLWAISSLLSFTNAGVQLPAAISTFSVHRAGIGALTLGHSSSFSNFAVSASKDRTCLIWDYSSGTVLRTYLLPGAPTALCTDAADRAVYVGYDDGSVQRLDLYQTSGSGGAGISQIADASAILQPSPSSRWQGPDDTCGAVRSLSLSFDSCTLLSGHDSGQILAWDVTKGGHGKALLQHPLPGSVNNLKFLPVQGLVNEAQPEIRVINVVKPKFGAFDNGSGSVPGNYAISLHLERARSKGSASTFESALSAPCFPDTLLDAGLLELRSFRNPPSTKTDTIDDADQDYMALDDRTAVPRQLSVEEQNAALMAEVEALRRLQAASFEKMERIDSERRLLLDREQKRLRALSNEVDTTMAYGNGNIYDDSSSSDG